MKNLQVLSVLRHSISKQRQIFQLCFTGREIEVLKRSLRLHCHGICELKAAPLVNTKIQEEIQKKIKDKKKDTEKIQLFNQSYHVKTSKWSHKNKGTFLV